MCALLAHQQRCSAIFKTFKLKVHQFCLKLTYAKYLTWHVRGPSRLNLLRDNCDVQYFCRVREEQLRLYLIFTSIKMHMFGKQSTLSHKETISTCCHHSVVKIILNFCALVVTAFPPVPPLRIKITVSRWRKTANKSHHNLTVNFELLSLLDEVGKIDSCGGFFVCVSPSKQPAQHFPRQLKKLELNLTLGPN